MCTCHLLDTAQLAGAIKYIDCISAEGQESPNECPGYDTKQSDGKVLVVLELRGIQITPSQPFLPGPLWPRVVAPERVLTMTQIEVCHLNWVQTNYLCLIELLEIELFVWSYDWC